MKLRSDCGCLWLIHWPLHLLTWNSVKTKQIHNVNDGYFV